MPMELSDPRPESESWSAHRLALYRFVLARVRDEAAAEDIVQDVLARAYAQRGSLKAPSRLRAWLYRITRNAIVDYYRSRKPTEPLPEDLEREAEAGGDNTAEHELARCLLPLLETMPEPYRTALKLVEFDGLKQREAARRLGISSSGAKSRVQRARRMLRDALLECCRIELDSRGHVMDYEPGEGCGSCAGD